ncbi:MAG: hypothetical protein WBN40_14025 [Pseudomonadales bacterium]
MSHLNPNDPNKVGADMGMHRSDRCAGQGIVHGAAGAGGGIILFISAAIISVIIEKMASG